MSENDLIAEYIKERYPELLKTFDFAAYRSRAYLTAFCGGFMEKLSEIDFTPLANAFTEALEKTGSLEDKG